MKIRRVLFVFAAGCQFAGLAAQAAGAPAPAASGPIESAWINPGLVSHHFNRSSNLNGNNYGLGVQLALSQANSVMAGRFRNSHDASSRYLSWLWQPYSIGPVRVGLMAGAMDGYPKMKNGGWFMVAMPVASLEYQMVGVNLTVVPSYKDKLYGAVAVQFKLRVWRRD
jgi:hypothetical protein